MLAKVGLKNNERSWRHSYHQLTKNVVLCRRPNQAGNYPYVLIVLQENAICLGKSKEIFMI